MNYRKIKLSRPAVEALLRSLHPEIPADARVARVTVDFAGGLTLTVHSPRFGRSGALGPVPPYSRDDAPPPGDDF